MSNLPKPRDLPTLVQLRSELKREQYRLTFGATLRSTAFFLVVVAAVAVLVATLMLPVLQIYGTSMTPTLNNGEIVLKILVKRVIAGAGQWVDIDEDGGVTVDGIPLDEPYLTEKSLGNCNVQLPYQVPDGRWFVMGDHRSVSVDSRDRAVGCVSEEQVVGRLVFRIWPLKSISPIQ